jgi:hypothetical protein
LRRALRALVSIGLVLAWLIGRPGRLSVAYARASRGWGWRSIGILTGRLVRVLIRVLTGLAGILGRTLVHILALIRWRSVGRGYLSILRIGRWSSLTPIALLTRVWCLLRSLLRRRNQGRTQCEARAQHSGKYPLQAISTHQIHC